MVRCNSTDADRVMVGTSEALYNISLRIMTGHEI